MVAIQGYEGSFHQEAAKEFFGKDVKVICCDNFRDVVRIAGSKKESDGGVMAIENSIAGSILPNYNLLKKSNLRIIGEVYLQIRQNLLVNPGVKLEDIREVHSHPMAIQQCFAYLDRRCWKLVETEDTALSAERLFITDEVLASEPAQDSAAAAALQGRFTERRRVAASFMFGARVVRFVTRSGVDAVNATEDIREGLEVLAIAGHTLGSGNGLQHDAFGLGDLYLGAEIGDHALAFLRGRIEARRLLETNAWDGVIGAADAFLYTGVGGRGGLVLTAQGAGGWHTSAPFQLVVSSPRTMRGFGLSALPAGQRVVVQAEHRYFLGTLFGAVDVGTALFADAGRGWAGDAPFGENTGTLVSAGGGIRLGFPTGSRLTTRFDLAFPVRGGSGYEFRVTVGRQFGISAPAPYDVERSRLPISTIDLFSFQRY